MAGNESERILGIDLGTTYSVVAHLAADGKPRTIENAEGDLTTPSVVFFDRTSYVVGKEAIKAGLFEPLRVAQFAKRDMGKSAYHRTICGERLPPEVIQALVLKKLKDDAQLKVGDVSKAVITVPAYFNEPRRKATQDAGRLAGLEVLDIINEPTAAAIAYGVEQGFLSEAGEAIEPQHVLVYDLGGGTFDATLMKLDGRHYRALATAGDVELGGIDWDRRIVDHVAEQFKREHRFDPRDDPVCLQSLLKEAEDAKRSLSTRENTAIHFAHEGRRVRLTLSRDEFRTLTEDLLQRTLFTVGKLLREAKLAWDDVDRVLLVGGSTRMPMVYQSLEEESGKSVDRSLSADEAVAHGAALYANLLASGGDQRRLRFEIQNVNSHDLGVLGVERQTGRTRRHVLIRRNTSLPTTGAGKFVTQHENQQDVVVNVVEGGDAGGRGATAIGKCIISDLPVELPAKSPVEVRFAYSPSGRLKVTAWLPTADRQATLTIERSAGLSESLLEEWRQRMEEGLLRNVELLDENSSSGSSTSPNTTEQAEAEFVPASGELLRGTTLQESNAEYEYEEAWGLDAEDDSQASDQRESDDPELGEFFKGFD